MIESMVISLRPKRQLTLPREACEKLGIGPGDRLELEVEEGALRIRPARETALESLFEIREAFQRSGMTEEELLDAGRRARETAYGEPRGGK